MKLILEDFLKAADAGIITKHETEHFIGFKYSPETVYGRNWSELALNARGVAFDRFTGEIIARPFKKFFNYSEFYNTDGSSTGLVDILPENFRPNCDGKFRVMDKVDGSLGISYFDKYDNRWRIKTGGSFDSDQAVWASNWLLENVNVSEMDIHKTYCFEIVYHEDMHICKYDYEGLILLGVIDNDTGEEESLMKLLSYASALNVCTAEILEFSKFEEVIHYAVNLPKTAEGVVVTFDNGYKCKIKSEEWLKLFRAASMLSKKFIWENVKIDEYHGYHFDEDFLTAIPEEFKEYKQYTVDLINTLNAENSLVAEVAYKLYASKMERKDVYQTAAAEYPKLVSAIMALYSCFVKNIDNLARVKQIILTANKP